MVLFGLVVVLVFIGLFFFMLAMLLANKKHAVDQRQHDAAEAGGGAMVIGCKHLPDALFWVSSGNIKESFARLKQFRQEYFSDARGPVRLAYDIFMATWHYLRDDPEYGNKVREKVIGEALGMEINDRTDVSAVEAGIRADAIGWPTIGSMGKAWATRQWMLFGELVRQLFREFMQPNGEIKIAMRVAPATFATLWNDKKVEGSHDVAQKLVEKYARELGWTPPTPVATTAPTATAAA